MMNIDHVVLWVDSPKDALDFFVDVVGLGPVRAQEFAEGKAGFPSVRVNETTILDLMNRKSAAAVRDFTGGGDGAGQLINHVCLSMDGAAYSALTERLRARGVELTSGGKQAFGAQGAAESSAYFRDPDGNVIEIRHYDQQRQS